jgi:hypothetical protein
LTIGDTVLLKSGGWMRVDGVAPSGRVEEVYNVEVEEGHTYFVGDGPMWGFAVWAHNARCLGIWRRARHGLRDHDMAMRGAAWAQRVGTTRHPRMPPGVNPARVNGRLQTRTNQGCMNPANPDGPPLRHPRTGQILRPDVQTLGTNGKVYVTEVTRRLPNGQINHAYHRQRAADMRAVYGPNWGGYHHVDI